MFNSLMFSNLRRVLHGVFEPKPFFIPFSPDYAKAEATWIDVETHNGVVVGVWFRNQMLPFQQDAVSRDAAHSRIEEFHKTDGFGVTYVEVDEL